MSEAYSTQGSHTENRLLTAVAAPAPESYSQFRAQVAAHEFQAVYAQKQLEQQCSSLYVNTDIFWSLTHNWLPLHKVNSRSTRSRATIPERPRRGNKFLMWPDRTNGRLPGQGRDPNCAISGPRRPEGIDERTMPHY